MKKLLLIMVTAMLVVMLAACGGDTDASDSKGELTIGGKNFTEQFILAKITSLYLEEHGYLVEEATNMGSEVLRQALESSQVDLYWEYTGTGLVNYLGQDPVASSQEAYEIVKDIDRNENDIRWLDMANLNNTYTLMMREGTASQLGITSVSKLAEYVNANSGELTFAANAEFVARPDGLPGVEEMYDFEFGGSNVVRMDSGLTYQALNDGQIDVAMGFSTDSRILGFNLLNLEDDLGFFPAYNAAVTIRGDVIEVHPELEELLAPLAQLINTETMTQLNYLVDIEQKNETEVAIQWLSENGLIEE